MAGADAAKAVTVQSGVQGRAGQAGAHGARWGVPLQQPAMSVQRVLISYNMTNIKYGGATFIVFPFCTIEAYARLSL